MGFIGQDLIPLARGFRYGLWAITEKVFSSPIRVLDYAARHYAGRGKAPEYWRAPVAFWPLRFSLIPVYRLYLL